MQRSDPQNDAKAGSRSKVLSRTTLGWLMHLLVIIACIAPGVWVNINAVLAQKGGYADVACVTGFAIAASVLTFFMMESLWQRRWWRAAGAFPLMTFFILLNWGIAMGGFSVVHDVMKETRSDQLRQREEEGQQARENRAKIDALRKAAGYDTPEMITAEIAKLKKDRRFQSSGGCATDGEKKITVKASESLCQEIDTLTGRLSAAKKIASLEDERRARGWKLGTDMENNAALSSDPMIDNLTQIVLTLFNLSVSAKLMGAIVAAVKALGVELLADVLPPIIVMLCRMLSAGGTASSTLRKTDIPEIAGASPELIKTNPPAMLALEILPDTSNPPEPLKQAPETNPPATPLNPPVDVLNAPTQMRTGESDLRRWTSEYLTLREGSGLQSKPLYEVYVVWAEARGIEPVTIAIFGRLMPLIGYPKLKDKKTGLMVYQGVALKQHNLKVVK